MLIDMHDKKLRSVTDDSVVECSFFDNSYCILWWRMVFPLCFYQTFFHAPLNGKIGKVFA